MAVEGVDMVLGGRGTGVETLLLSLGERDGRRSIMQPARPLVRVVSVCAIAMQSARPPCAVVAASRRVLPLSHAVPAGRRGRPGVQRSRRQGAARWAQRARRGVQRQAAVAETSSEMSRCEHARGRARRWQCRRGFHTQSDHSGWAGVSARGPSAPFVTRGRVATRSAPKSVPGEFYPLQFP